MAVEENGSVKLEEGPHEGFITYRRRKRVRPSSDGNRGEVLGGALHKEREEDIGWKHGEVVDGNRFHWMCNWCGLIRYSGGVSRLKKHLAGGFNVKKCPTVPDDVAKDIRNHLMLKKKLKEERLRNRGLTDVKLSVSNTKIQAGSLTKLTRGGTPQSKAVMQDSMAVHTSETGFQLENSTGLTKEGHERCKINIRRSKNAQKIDLENQIGSAKGLAEVAQVESATRSYKGTQVANGSTVVEEVRKGVEINTQKCRNHLLGCTENHEEAQNGNITGLTGGWSKRVKNVAYPSSHTCETVTQVGSNPELTKRVNVESVAGLNEAANRSRKDIFQRFIDDIPSCIKEHRTKDIDDTISCTNNTFDLDKQDRGYAHWRNVLEHILELPDMSEEGGIVNCIRDALKYGPGYSKNFKISVSSEHDRCLLDTEVEGQCQQVSLVNGVCCPSETRTSDAKINTTMCKKVFLAIICSEQFSLLCDLYCEYFQDMTVKSFFDFSLVNFKMKSGDYELSPELFDQDIQQVWHKFQKIGKQLVHLAISLSSMSQISCQKQGTCQVDAQQNNSVKSLQFNFCEVDHSTRPNQIEASILYEVCTCKICGMEANGERSLICDGCEASYHISCVEPAIMEVPTRSWYCTACTVRNNDSPESTHVKKGSLHQSCAVCNRLGVSETKENNGEIEHGNVRDDGSRESSVSSMDSDNPRELSGTTTMPCLCKICGTCEEEDKKFLVCGHTQCPYKFYHIRCLKSSQIASQQQQKKPCWYCPSCLCRDCFCDIDDDKIVLCDGCDEAYHTYCMKPPLTSIPRGQWYCVQCNIARAREGMKRYEHWVLQQHRRNEVTQSNETYRSMDLLLNAAEKLRSEEQLVSGR